MKIKIQFEGQSKEVEFTKPQAWIVNQLQNGKRATMINTHHRDGGDFVWYDKDGYGGGAIFVGYKAFNGAMRAIVKAFNLTREQENRLYDNYIV